jgi:hypothetical protein
MTSPGGVVALSLACAVGVTYGVDSFAKRAGSERPAEWAAGAFALVVGAALFYVRFSL